MAIPVATNVALSPTGTAQVEYIDLCAKTQLSFNPIPTMITSVLVQDPSVGGPLKVTQSVLVSDSVSTT